MELFFRTAIPEGSELTVVEVKKQAEALQKSLPEFACLQKARVLVCMIRAAIC